VSWHKFEFEHKGDAVVDVDIDVEITVRYTVVIKITS